MTAKKDNAPQIESRSRLLTLAEVSDLSTLGMTKIFELVGTGELPSVKIGSRRLVPLFAYESWVSSLLESSSEAGDE